MSVTVDSHTYTCRWMPSSALRRGDSYVPTCSCGWRGKPTSDIGVADTQWSAHVGVRPAGEVA